MSRGASENITLKDLAKMLKTSPVTLISIKKRLGFKKRSFIKTEDIPAIRDELIYIQKHSTKCKKENKGYYQEALEIIERDGFIGKKHLLDIFKTSKLSGIEAFFLKEENPIYDNEDEKIDTKSVQFRLFNVQKAEWIKENNTNGTFNNNYHGSNGRLF